MNEVLIKELRQALMNRLEELSGLRADARESRGTVALDQTSVGRLSRMDALQGQQMALAQDRNREAEIWRIEAALQRMDDDGYGYCLKCDEEIAERRLRFDPAAPMCIACAK